jgi:hypothetical protein
VVVIAEAVAAMGRGLETRNIIAAFVIFVVALPFVLVVVVVFKWIVYR